MSKPLEVELREVRIPFRFRYGHALKQHSGLAAVVCLARDGQGRLGMGEAVPRDYVTGETCDSVFADAPLLWPSLAAEPDGTLDVKRLAEQRQSLASRWDGPFPSCALSAIDTALCDLWARQAGVPLHGWLGAADEAPIEYAASIGISGSWKLSALLWLYRGLGFRHFKVKVGDEHDVDRVRAVRGKLGSDAKIFVDANASWTPEQAARKIERLARHGVWAVEEPLARSPAAQDSRGRTNWLDALDDDHYRRCQWLQQRSELPLIADESLICWQTLRRIRDTGAFRILNVRLSKCGGPLLSSQIVRYGREAELPFALGAMVGETPILAAAGAHFAASHPDRLYVQGFSHRLLHRRRFASGEPPLRRARVSLRAATPGLGLRLDARRLDQLTVRSIRLDEP